jgi:hypothetical protein
VSAVPTLSKLAVQLRGDEYVPCVLIRAGGVFPGVIWLRTTAVIGRNGCCDWMRTLNDCRFVLGITSKVHVVAADVVGSPSRSMVSVPVQMPSRNDRGADGELGVASRPQPVIAKRDTTTAT